MGGWGMPGVGFGMGPGMGFERPVEETVVNNYYDSPGQERSEHGDYGRDFERGGGGDTQFQDASWNDNSGSGFDGGGDSGSGFDDSGSFDDGGSSGDGSGF
jgi:hypothetical protein